MSFYRTLLAAAAAIAISAPVFADDSSNNTQGANDQPNQAMQVSEASNANATSQSMTTDTSTATDQKVNLNTASAKELMKVKGLNASKARAIVAYRKKHGNFKSTDDLANVKGFKKMNADMMKSIQGQLTVE